MRYKVSDWGTVLQRIKLVEKSVHDNTKLMISLFKRKEMKDINLLKLSNNELKKELNKLKQKLWRIQEQLLNTEE